MKKTLNKEIILYSIIVVILIAVSILNNKFWKFGIEEKEKYTNQVQQLEINNVIYNVPYEEQWLD